MVSHTPLYNIPYPDATDKPKDAATHFRDIAMGVDTALGAAEIPPAVAASIYVAPSAAARDAYWGTPVIAADQLVLQNRGATTIRTDTGWTERYFAAYNVSSNPGGRTPAGWYPDSNGTTRARQVNGSAGFGAAWTSIPLDTLVDVHPPTPPGFTFSAGSRGFTITRAGVFLLAGAITMSAGTFVGRIYAGRALGFMSGSASAFSASASASAWLDVGTLVTLQVLTTGSLNSMGDTADNPTALTITSLPS